MFLYFNPLSIPSLLSNLEKITTPLVNVVWKMLVDRVDRHDLVTFVCYCNMGKGKWDCKGKKSIIGQLNHCVSGCSYKGKAEDEDYKLGPSSQCNYIPFSFSV